MRRESDKSVSNNQGPGPVSATEEYFVRLYDNHYDEVHAFCARRVGRIDAGDAAAEVFYVAWRRIDEIDASTSRAWLFGVARKVVLNQWRSTSRRSRLLDRARVASGAGPEQPEAVVVRRAEDEVVLAALKELRESDQEILRLSAWEELSGPEMATALGISVSAAQQRLHRAKKRLARRLRDRPDEAGQDLET
jgi:RNA polymerase sigma-70 factor (ECF subfamily)